MWDSLPDLHLRHPGVGRVGRFAVIALLVRHCELDDESLLKHRVCLYFLLNSNFDLDSS